METFNFSVPQDITVGKGSLSKLPEIAKKLGISRSYVSRIEKKALQKLCRALEHKQG